MDGIHPGWNNLATGVTFASLKSNAPRVELHMEIAPVIHVLFGRAFAKSVVDWTAATASSTGSRTLIYLNDRQRLDH